MRWGLVTIFLWLSGPAWAGSDPFESPYERKIQKILERAQPKPVHEVEFERFWRGVLEKTQDEEERYLATQALNLYLNTIDRRPEAHRNCQTIPPRADDYLAQATCLDADPELSRFELANRVEKIFHEARIHGSGTSQAAHVIYRATNDTTFYDDIPRAVSLLRQALETVPLEDRHMQYRLKRNMAVVYINPSNAPEVVHQGISLFDETERYFLEKNDWVSAENSAYNKGVAYVLSIKDHQAALKEFEKIQRDFTLVPDARIFQAFALAKLKRFRDAETILRQVNMRDYRDEERIPFLNCYRQLTRALMVPGTGVSDCIRLPRYTQIDVILHLTEEISQLPLSQAEERLLYQQFYWFYQNRLAPTIQTTLSKSIDGMELQRSRYESRLKDAQLETQRRYSEFKTYALIGSIILLFGLSASWFSILGQHQKIRRLHLYIQKQVLQRFLPPEIIGEILAGRNRLDENARTMSVTVLFADLCEFTRQSEGLGPERTATVLNAFLVRMTEVIFAHGGTIDKFMGDGIMVIFGAPTELPESMQAAQAVKCSIAMQKALMDLNVEWQAAGIPAFKMRIGIHQGHAVVGSFGGPQRSDFTVIGTTVNIGSRIERLAKPGDILISRDLARHLPREQVISTGLHELRGVEQPQELFVLKEMRWHSASA